MKRKVLPVVCTSLLLGLFFDFLFYGKLIGISFFLYCTLVLLLTFYLATYYKRALGKSVLLLTPLVLFFASMTFIRASIFLTVLNMLFVIYLLLLIVQIAANPGSKLQHYAARQYFLGTLTLPLQFVGRFLTFLQRLINSREEMRLKKHKVAPVIRGLLLSLPFLFIFLLLLSSADLVFKRYVNSIFDFQISPELFPRVFLISFISSLFIGAYILIFSEPASHDGVTKTANRKINLGTVESSIILGSVAALFLIFVMIQVTYLFGGQSNITSTGFTYSEYARKGFFELIAVALISLALILAINGSSVRQSLQQKLIFMWLSGVVIMEVMVIMLSAHRRLSLYEQAYGFTTLRLYSHIFIAWLAIVFVLLLIHIIREQRENMFAFQAFLSVVAFLALVNFMNPDAFIARQNIQRFNNTSKMDVFYLINLSDDAVPEITKLLQHPNSKLQKAVASHLYLKKHNAERQPDPWQSFNVSRSRAQKLIGSSDQQLEANKNYLYELHEFE